MTIPPHTQRPASPQRMSPPGPADQLWQRALQEGTPLVTGSGATRTYTFVHRGEARRVALVTNKLIDDTTVGEALFERMPGSEIWQLSLKMGAGWRGSYAIAVDDATPLPDHRVVPDVRTRRRRALAATPPERHGGIHDWYDLLERAVPDPWARERGSLGSVGVGPEAPKPLPMPRTPRAGTITQVGEAAWWHVPDDVEHVGKWDVLVLIDGDRWARGNGTELDAWAANDVLPPTATLLLGHAELENRVEELTCNPTYLQRICDLIGASELPLTSDPQRTTIAGASLGGLTALYAQCLRPDRFGASICQSGSFWWPNPHGGVAAEWLTRTIERSDVTFDRVHLEVGLAEWVLLEPTRRLQEVLRSRCGALDYHEFDGGHDIACWNIHLPKALRWVRNEARHD